MGPAPGSVAIHAHIYAWVFGGSLPSGPIALTLDGCTRVEIREASDADRHRWSGSAGPPIRLDLQRHVAVGCDLHLSVSAQVLDDFTALQNPEPYDLYRLLRQWEFSFRADQVIDLITLVVEVPVAMAFGEAHIDAEHRGGA